MKGPQEEKTVASASPKEKQRDPSLGQLRASSKPLKPPGRTNLALAREGWDQLVFNHL